MKHTVTTRWKENMEFESEIDSHAITIDAQAEHGGSGKGPSPKKLLLSALAGCTGMDVVSILKKMKVSFSSLSIQVDAQMTEDHPKHYSEFLITYNFTGTDADIDKLRKAIELSQDKYCGVSHMFRQFAKVNYDIIVTD